ncbi:MAG: DUF1015 domain-containing protein [Dehalococcoidia bacterium]|nr:DUF1015 domain-containing protein [Dehalococcoidia bacterium]
MSDVQPFRGLRYNMEKIPDIASVIAPPYDVVSSEEQQDYYRNNLYNIIRLEFGETFPSDSSEENRYTRAAITLEHWMSDDILTRDNQPAFYVLEHRFLHRGVEMKRWELIARVRLFDWSSGRIRPHEITIEQHKADRLQLLKSCRANISPVMGIVPSKTGGLLSLFTKLTGEKPLFSVSGGDGVNYSMWMVTDERDIARITDMCNTGTIYIADGHHRYETALEYRDEQMDACQNCNNDEAFNFVMMTLVAEDDPGLLVLPLHRLVRGLAADSSDELIEKLGRLFYISELRPNGSTLHETVLNWLNILEEWGREEAVFGLYGLNGKNLCLLVSRDRPALERDMPDKYGPSWRCLDVSLLHWSVLRGVMGIDTMAKEDECLEYIPDALDAIRQVDSGKYQIAFLMNVIPICDILSVADARERIPQKSTYFYPKSPTGLVLNPLWD